MRPNASITTKHNFVLRDKVWEENQRLFRSIVFAIVRNPADIDDVLQETYRRVLKTPYAITSREEAFYYLKKSVRNTAIDWNRRSIRRNLTVKEQVSDYDRLEELHSSGESPLSQLLEEERKQSYADFISEVYLAIDELPEKQRDAVKAFFSVRGSPSPKELCIIKNIPYSTLRSRMVKGIDSIRDILSEKNIPGFAKNISETLLKKTEKSAVK